MNQVQPPLNLWVDPMIVRLFIEEQVAPVVFARAKSIGQSTRVVARSQLKGLEQVARRAGFSGITALIDNRRQRVPSKKYKDFWDAIQNLCSEKNKDSESLVGLAENLAQQLNWIGNTKKEKATVKQKSRDLITAAFIEILVIAVDYESKGVQS
jgi:hypothetical protein